MDTFIYIGIALVLAIALFFAFGKKRSETQPTQLTPKDETARKPAAQSTELEPRSGDRQADLAKKASSGAESGARAEPSVPREPEAAIDERPVSSGPARKRDTKRDISGLRQGLSRSREKEGFFGRLKALLSGRAEISPQIAEEIEEVLLSSDVGVATTSALLDQLKADLSSGELTDEAAVWKALRSQVTRMLDIGGSAGGLTLSHKPTVVLLVGVNGAGKTTTIGKLATKLKAQGIQCVLAAADTFRAAAVQQLVVWGDRVGCEVVRGKDGADPGSVVFDAIKKAQELGADLVLADTAGRLHTKANLMAEMQKIARTAAKALNGAPHEILLVIDSTNGQNALAQAKEFKDALEVTGIVLTKLDGTAKGGVVLGIADSLELPVRFIGLGERPDDLHEFVAEDFVEALLGKET